MEDNQQPNPAPVMPPVEPTPAPEPMPQPVEPAPAPAPAPMPEAPKKKNSTLILVLVLVGVIVAAVACYFLFLAPKSTNRQSNNNNSQQDQPAVPDEPEEMMAGAVIEGDSWNVTFPGYTKGDMTVYNETFGFILPKTVTSIDFTMHDLTKTADNAFEFDINRIITTTGNYDAKTICGYEDETIGITIGGIIRRPTDDAAPVVNGSTILEVSAIGSDENFTYYAWIGLSDEAAKCQLDSAKQAEAKALLDELFGFELLEK